MSFTPNFLKLASAAAALVLPCVAGCEHEHREHRPPPPPEPPPPVVYEPAPPPPPDQVIVVEPGWYYDEAYYDAYGQYHPRVYYYYDGRAWQARNDIPRGAALRERAHPNVAREGERRPEPAPTERHDDHRDEARPMDGGRDNGRPTDGGYGRDEHR